MDGSGRPAKDKIMQKRCVRHLSGVDVNMGNREEETLEYRLSFSVT